MRFGVDRARIPIDMSRMQNMLVDRFMLAERIGRIFKGVRISNQPRTCARARGSAAFAWFAGARAPETHRHETPTWWRHLKEKLVLLHVDSKL